jgi:hypothetical protein
MAELDLVSQVTSPSGKQLHPLENVHSGQFAFTSKESGKYVACFWLQSAHPNVHLNFALDWKTSVGGKRLGIHRPERGAGCVACNYSRASFFFQINSIILVFSCLFAWQFSLSKCLFC